MGKGEEKEEEPFAKAPVTVNEDLLAAIRMALASLSKGRGQVFALTQPRALQKA